MGESKLTNRQRFAEAYERNLLKAVEKYPDRYHATQDDVPGIAARMVAAAIAGSANKNGSAFQWTCKELGIKHTYTAIKEYLK